MDFLGKIYGLKEILVKETIEISSIKVSWHSLLSYNTQFCVYKILDRSSNYAKKSAFYSNLTCEMSLFGSTVRKITKNKRRPVKVEDASNLVLD